MTDPIENAKNALAEARAATSEARKNTAALLERSRRNARISMILSGIAFALACTAIALTWWGE